MNKYIIIFLMASLIGYGQKNNPHIAFGDSLQYKIIEELKIERAKYREVSGIIGVLPSPIFVEGLRKTAIHRARYISKFSSNEIWEICKSKNKEILHIENKKFPGIILLKDKNDRALYFDLKTDECKDAKNTQEVIVALYIEKETTSKDIAKYVIAEFKESFKNEPHHWGALMRGCNDDVSLIYERMDQIGIGASILYFNDSKFPRALVTIEIGYYGDYML
jgi:hypothetical protein